MNRAMTVPRTETRNLMLATMELAAAKKEGDADRARWAVDDLAVLAKMALTPRIQSRAIAELCRIGFWNNCQPEPSAAEGA